MDEKQPQKHQTATRTTKKSSTFTSKQNQQFKRQSTLQKASLKQEQNSQIQSNLTNQKNQKSTKELFNHINLKEPQNSEQNEEQQQFGIEEKGNVTGSNLDTRILKQFEKMKQNHYLKVVFSDHECKTEKNGNYNNNGQLYKKCIICGKIILNPIFTEYVDNNFNQIIIKFLYQQAKNNITKRQQPNILTQISDNIQNQYQQQQIFHPFGTFYVDYEQKFFKKMELDNKPPQNIKRFLQFTNLQKMRDWAYCNLGDCNVERDFQHLPDLIKDEITKYNQQKQELDFGNIIIHGNYENSNIGMVVINKEMDQLQILLRNDINTKGCLHWFNFSIEVIQPCQINIQIMNNTRSGILYQEGMRLAIKDSLYPEKQWHRSNNTIYYYKSNVGHAFYQKHNSNITNNNTQQKILQKENSDNNNNTNTNIPQSSNNLDTESNQNFIDQQQYTNKLDNSPYPQSFRDKEEKNSDSNNNQSNINDAGQNSNKNDKNNNSLLKQQSNTVQIQQPQSSTQQQNINAFQTKEKQFYTLQYNYDFKTPGQVVQMAYCFPYTFTDLIKLINRKEQYLLQSQQITSSSYMNKKIQNLNKYLHKIPKEINFKDRNQRFTQNVEKKILLSKIQTKNCYYKKYIIGYTRLGFPILMLKISSPKNYYNEFYSIPYDNRKVIFIQTRQHPSESPGSWVCQGVINFLLSDSQQAQCLRSIYIFIILPMINVDGVVLGLSRCSATGLDLNRKWAEPDQDLCPEVYQVKQLLKKIQEKRIIFIFTDLHGHSTKKQSFFYGCDKLQGNGAHTWTQVRVLPKIMSTKTHLFSYKECKFRVTPDKASTARVVAWQEFKIMNSFTFETSFFGYKDPETQNNKSFTTQDIESLGENLCLTFLEYTAVLDNINGELNQNNKLTAKKLKKKSSQRDFEGNNNNNNINNNNIIQNNSNIITNTNINNNENNNNLGIQHIQQKKDIYAKIQSSQHNSQKNLFSKQNFKSQSSQKNLIVSQILNSNQKQENQKQNEENSSIHNSQITMKQQQNYKNSHVGIQQLCPNMKDHWRSYFAKGELQKNYKKIDYGQDPNNEESISGSDSDPEGELFDEVHKLMKPQKKKEKKKEVVEPVAPLPQPVIKEEKPEWRPVSNTNLLNSKMAYIGQGVPNSQNYQNSQKKYKDEYNGNTKGNEQNSNKKPFIQKNNNYSKTKSSPTKNNKNSSYYYTKSSQLPNIPTQSQSETKDSNFKNSAQNTYQFSQNNVRTESNLDYNNSVQGQQQQSNSQQISANQQKQQVCNIDLSLQSNLPSNLLSQKMDYQSTQKEKQQNQKMKTYYKIQQSKKQGVSQDGTSSQNNTYHSKNGSSTTNNANNKNNNNNFLNNASPYDLSWQKNNLKASSQIEEEINKIEQISQNKAICDFKIQKYKIMNCSQNQKIINSPNKKLSSANNLQDAQNNNVNIQEQMLKDIVPMSPSKTNPYPSQTRKFIKQSKSKQEQQQIIQLQQQSSVRKRSDIMPVNPNLNQNNKNTYNYTRNLSPDESNKRRMQMRQEQLIQKQAFRQKFATNYPNIEEDSINFRNLQMQQQQQYLGSQNSMGQHINEVQQINLFELQQMFSQNNSISPMQKADKIMFKKQKKNVKQQENNLQDNYTGISNILQIQHNISNKIQPGYDISYNTIESNQPQQNKQNQNQKIQNSRQVESGRDILNSVTVNKKNANNINNLVNNYNNQTGITMTSTQQQQQQKYINERVRNYSGNSVNRTQKQLDNMQNNLFINNTKNNNNIYNSSNSNSNQNNLNNYKDTTLNSGSSSLNNNNTHSNNEFDLRPTKGVSSKNNNYNNNNDINGQELPIFKQKFRSITAYGGEKQQNNNCKRYNISNVQYEGVYINNQSKINLNDNNTN